MTTTIAVSQQQPVNNLHLINELLQYAVGEDAVLGTFLKYSPELLDIKDILTKMNQAGVTLTMPRFKEVLNEKAPVALNLINLLHALRVEAQGSLIIKVGDEFAFCVGNALIARLTKTGIWTNNGVAAVGDEAALYDLVSGYCDKFDCTIGFQLATEPSVMRMDINFTVVTNPDDYPETFVALARFYPEFQAKVSNLILERVETKGKETWETHIDQSNERQLSGPAELTEEMLITCEDGDIFFKEALDFGDQWREALPIGTFSVRYGNHSRFGDFCYFTAPNNEMIHRFFGVNTTFGSGCIFGTYTHFEKGTVFQNAYFKNKLHFPEECKFYGCRFEVACVFGSNCEFDEYCDFASEAAKRAARTYALTDKRAKETFALGTKVTPKGQLGNSLTVKIRRRRALA